MFINFGVDSNFYQFCSVIFSNFAVKVVQTRSAALYWSVGLVNQKFVAGHYFVFLSVMFVLLLFLDGTCACSISISW